MSSRIESIDNSDVLFMHKVECMTQQEIADYYGVTQTTICFRLHPEKQREHNDKYSQMENIKEAKKRYCQSEKYKKVRKRYMQTDKGKAALKRYQQTEKFDEAMKKYHQSDKGKVSKSKEKSKRRDLGFIPLNDPIDGGEWHHIDGFHVIHIPYNSHHSTPHNVRTGQGMEEINAIAFQYITEETFDKLLAGGI